MRPRLRGLPLALLLFGIALSSQALAQDKGSISGKVTDKKTGHALPFATVTVVGAQRGALSDAEGEFVVPGVPAGTWEVRVQYLGYGPQARPGIAVTAG